MANKTIFGNAGRVPVADTTNAAGGTAYAMTPEHALAQFLTTGCFNDSYYTDAAAQLHVFKGLAEKVEPAFLARAVLYAREKGYMKDAPAAGLAILRRRDVGLFHRIFRRVVDSGKLILTFWQMVRSGQFGGKGFSYALKRRYTELFNHGSVELLLSASIGNDPSLRDVLRLVRPRPANDERRALFGWLTGRMPAAVPTPDGRRLTEEDLPVQVRDLLAYRKAETEDEQVAIIQRNRFRWDLLAGEAKGPKTWKAIARWAMGFMALRMNLNTLLRHGVFADEEMTAYVAGRLGDPAEVAKSRQFPYQFLAAYLNCDPAVPASVRMALSRAADAACGNVPKTKLPLVVGVDVSGSMSSAVTGGRGRGQTSTVRCVDAAAVFAAAILRTNPDSVIVPFDDRAHEANFDPSDSVLSVASRLAKYGGGGTAVSLALSTPKTRWPHRKFAGAVILSDMESWTDSVSSWFGRTVTSTAVEWDGWRQWQAALGNPDPRLVCINLQAGQTVQHPNRPDVLNLGGFSDAVFNVVADYVDGVGPDAWVAAINAIDLP